jgi:hypothetical protein
MRLLRDPESVARRFGPTCAAKDLASATDAIDLAFAIAWQADPLVEVDGVPRTVAQRWFRAGAQAPRSEAP